MGNGPAMLSWILQPGLKLDLRFRAPPCSRAPFQLIFGKNRANLCSPALPVQKISCALSARSKRSSERVQTLILNKFNDKHHNACSLTPFLVTSLVSPAPWPREPREILPLLLPALVTGGVPQAQVVLYSGTSALFAPLLNKRTGERVENT